MEMKSRNRLIFGNELAQSFDNPSQWSDYVNSTLAGVASVDTPKNKKDFYSNGRIQKVGNVRVGVADRSSTYIKRNKIDESIITLSIPLSGSREFICGKKSFNAFAKKSMFLSGTDDPFSYYSDGGMDLVIFMQTDCLDRIIKANKILQSNGLRKIDYSHSQMIETDHLSHDFIETYIQISEIFDDLKGMDSEISRLGLDDLIQRIFLNIIADNNNFRADNMQSDDKMIDHTTLDMVCDAVGNYSNKVMTITEMQELTGLSTRALHVAFRKRFDCTPREWQRNEHLNRAREMLLSNSSNMSVSEVAHHQGFVSEKTFTRFYLTRFGELPSETLRRKK